MNKELNNVIVENQKVYAENQKATHTNIKTLDDVIAAMDRIRRKLFLPTVPSPVMLTLQTYRTN